MQTKEFRAFRAQIERLTPSQRKQTLYQIKERCDIDTVETVIGSVESCPHCNNTDLYKWGINAGIQRYKCRSCQKTLQISQPIHILHAFLHKRFLTLPALHSTDCALCTTILQFRVV